ncbi:hypothetical protein [Methanobacterium spitsbergense]|uniref:Uncharacterized protein n=1 Tax=Methanobacterium spitsbergense TaxID=2874285 RepID=A0A8T5UZX6_9EURY|nr:hypothetical protein [Methanobacterium spitsbergense]MBZ2166363.1 hypothetical protein [Methanobacterium spitsbergense]
MSASNSKLSDYMDNVVEKNIKPKNDSTPWKELDTNFLLESATTDLHVYGHPRIKRLADYFQRTENAIVVQLSKKNWYYDHGLGQEPKERKGTIKMKVLDYVRGHPWVFCSDIDKALKVKSSSALSTLHKEGKLKRIPYSGNGKYLYYIEEIPVEIEKVEAKPGGAPGTLNILEKFVKYLKESVWW